MFVFAFCAILRYGALGLETEKFFNFSSSSSESSDDYSEVSDAIETSSGEPEEKGAFLSLFNKE